MASDVARDRRKVELTPAPFLIAGRRRPWIRALGKKIEKRRQKELPNRR